MHRTLPRVATAASLLVALPACDLLSGQSQPSPESTVAPSAPPVTPSPTASASPSPSPSPTPTTFAETYEDVHSGVVRIDVQGCDGIGSGTGFLIGEDLVATVEHVVRDAATVRVTHGTRSTSATVLGLDESTDTALLRTNEDLEGHGFDFAADGPAVGERIGSSGSRPATPAC
jgi:S1-C subfamily serine protease